mmetsp:Transcript_17961/g.52516  ORF Transcript_17961/g.52516 Transcript_17961/m.52516 type:complete len:282 (+) Transcript_17961:734-1579(+)
MAIEDCKYRVWDVVWQAHVLENADAVLHAASPPRCRVSTPHEALQHRVCREQQRVFTADNQVWEADEGLLRPLRRCSGPMEGVGWRLRGMATLRGGENGGKNARVPSAHEEVLQLGHTAWVPLHQCPASLGLGEAGEGRAASIVDWCARADGRVLKQHAGQAQQQLDREELAVLGGQVQRCPPDHIHGLEQSDSRCGPTQALLVGRKARILSAGRKPQSLQHHGPGRLDLAGARRLALLMCRRRQGSTVSYSCRYVRAGRCHHTKENGSHNFWFVLGASGV